MIYYRGLDISLDEGRGYSHKYGHRKNRFPGRILPVLLILAAAAAAVFLLWKVFGPDDVIVTEGEKEGGGQTALFGGAELAMLTNQGEGQMLSVLLTSKSGGLIVIDGGRWEDGDYLIEQIKKRGGRVDAWLLTHTHTDHTGALIKILQMMEEGEDPGIEIESFYYNFASIDWYLLHDEQEVGTSYTISALLAEQPQEKLHIVKKGDVIEVDDIRVEVVNNRYEPDADHVGDNDGNDTSLVFKALINGTAVLFLGDLGETAGDLLLGELGKEGLKADVVQMAHHGQDGVSRKFYRAVDPSVCLWPTPQWLWDNEDGAYETTRTKIWMNSFGMHVRQHFCTKDGDQILR